MCDGKEEEVLLYLFAFVETTMGADDVGMGGLVAVGTGNKLWKNYLMSGPAFALTAGRMAAFLKRCHAGMILSVSTKSFNKGSLSKSGRSLTAAARAVGIREKSAYLATLKLGIPCWDVP
ncbi:MAG: hypothetical protein UX80_C0009G0046 [Candidatus Amesbacteria bacterium GW2011_GWA2_47_11b]|uniref:Uncharacterized protein n=3 Tax=Candidatus Amesiibacteriota TaxID=1752730 RepID=A0A0G1SDU5_9BACT|nr:MAG: hypothetical protein UX42_C0006G0014 [Microgenomates group bacterium GW2011_GWC1_46_20]KKU57831.1 MAG: hypothetical protein UX80_C0009G0046 [Candidatus Amesbacteria bacterium GW2011_GWA2_47_11b]KKU67586.1 MAG: hypothetical protein UX92_C0030G0014 [Candidatus Amesbacteria bacterium GW2011_GWA1_47_20]KKU82723.1 MAG: hypothetical protein UY11_C0040G0005 [Candidatus Amesbacteria bacterium GW2011_GWC2_47_8]